MNLHNKIETQKLNNLKYLFKYFYGNFVVEKLKDFNRDVFKKSISPYRKWAYVEALACFLKGADLCDWMGE